MYNSRPNFLVLHYICCHLAKGLLYNNWHLLSDSTMDHRWLLCVGILTDILVLSESADLQVLIGGMNVGRSASCTGENVTYVCNIISVGHVWSINGGPCLVVTLTPQVINEGYTLQLVSFNDTIVSSLSVTSFDGLNGINVTCTDPVLIDPLPPQEAVAMVLAPPSLPELDVNQVMENNETVNIMVTPPLVSPECVLQYNIITYSNCESIRTDITVDPNTDPTQPVQLTRVGLNLCTCSYNFTASAVTRNGTGERSAPVTIKISDIVGNPDFTITNEGFKVTVSINPQEPSVFVDVKRSSAGDTNCVVNVERNTNITSSETTLDCSFAGLTPTFCVQFIDGSCQSELVQRTTATKLPSLLSGVNITSSTSSIDVMVDVNESINCDTSQLSTRTTISGENGVIFMNTSAFKDVVIVFEPPSPGVYTCNISIMSGNTILKSMEEPCSNIVDTRSTSQNSTSIILGISISVIFLVSFLFVGLLLMWCWYKRKSKNTFDQQSSSGPVYETVSSPQAKVIELETNKAYGYLK